MDHMVWVSLEPIILSVSSQDRPRRAEVQTHANTLQHTHTQRRNTHSVRHNTHTHTQTLNEHKDTHTHTSSRVNIYRMWMHVHTCAISAYHSSPQGESRSPF